MKPKARELTAEQWRNITQSPVFDTPSRTVPDPPLVTRGFLQLGQARWVRPDEIVAVSFYTGGGPDQALLSLRGGGMLYLDDAEARDAWVAWTTWLGEGER